MAKTSVYVGPTISRASVLERLPGAVLHPPVAGGDLMKHGHHAGDCVLIIDGYYRDRPSVRHKEILSLLRQQVSIIGAASMGALRAAELDCFGMIGVGDVYDMYRTGEIDGDDEVALLHDDSSTQYRATTIALVSLRHLCRIASATIGLSQHDARQIVVTAKSLPFVYRSWPTIVEALDERLAVVAEQLRAIAVARHTDVKWQDALQALDMARSASLSQPSQYAPLTRLSNSWNLYWSTAEHTYQSDSISPAVSDLDVLNAGRLFSPHYPALHYQHICELLNAASTTGRDKTKASLPEYARAELGIEDGGPPPIALCRRFLYDSECRQLEADDLVTLIAARSWLTGRSLDWRPKMVEKCRATPHWAAWRRIVRLADSANERLCQVRGGKPPRLWPERRLRDLFYDLWGCTDGAHADIELWRRGFPDVSNLVSVARRFGYLELLRRCKADGVSTL